MTLPSPSLSPQSSAPKHKRSLDTHLFRVAAVTMCRGDHFFLKRWIDYYGKALGKENLFIILDGEDEPSPPNGEGATILRVVHKELERAAGDKHRIGLLNQLSFDLFQKGYQAVIGCDSDEFLVIDPKEEISLVEYLQQLYLMGYTSASALGIDVGQNLNSEQTIDPSLPLLAQRKYAVLSSRYTKASVKFLPQLRWGSGFHRIKGRNYKIAPSLFLFHTGYSCESFLKKREEDPARVNGGWENHLAKRGKTILYATKKKAKQGDQLLHISRYLQQIFRPIYALNKPLMPTPPIVIEIPKRFRQITF